MCNHCKFLLGLIYGFKTQIIMKEEQNIVVSTFYKFFDNPRFEEIRLPLKFFCRDHGIKGIIIMANEGLNATISGSREELDNFFDHIKNEYGFKFCNVKESRINYHPFRKIKVKAKKEIVTLGMPEINGLEAGVHVKPEKWDEFIERDDVVLIDTRNTYEIILGSFKGAVNPQTENFRDFPEWFEKHKQEFAGKKIAMCCTGGIRCEKSTAYLKSRGVKEVYHLEGGILNYLMKLRDKAKTWYGDCFVFDKRIAVNKQIEQVHNTTCISS